MKRLPALFALIFLAGCSFAHPRDVGRANTFALSSLAREAAMPQNPGVLMLAYPTAPSELDTYRIAVIRADGRQDYIASARWADFLPATLNAVLIETLRSSGGFSHVEPDDGGIQNQFELYTQVNRFTARYPAKGKPPFVDVSVTFHLKDAAGATLAEFTAARKVTARENSMSAIADAFDHAFMGIERDLVANLKKAGPV